jgi:hypothetical protein
VAKSGVGIEVVEPILRFLEANPDANFGMPGLLVHFVERFYKHGYEEALIDSINRAPTFQTIWMLNRLINGTTLSDERKLYIKALSEAKFYCKSNQLLLNQVDHFLRRLDS